MYYFIVVLRFIVKEMLGQGTFGQVVKCWDTESNDYVAVKVIKNQPAFYHQAIMEVSLLRMVR
jgi:dual specificity protein kinase YAK1